MFDMAVTEEQEGLEESVEKCDKISMIALNGGFSTGDGSYKFEIKSDGTGTFFYSDLPGDSENFAHEVKVERLALEIEEAIKDEIALQSEQTALDDSEIQNIRNETTSEMLEGVFWEEINQILEDPFFRSFEYDSEWGEEFQCEGGTIEEFTEFLKLCALTERKIECAEDFLIVEAETEIDEAGLSECSYYTERLGELVEIACEYYKPSGYRYDYNDGCYDRMSGYSMSSESISVSLAEVARAPVREKMLGMIELRKKLAAMDTEGEKIERLTAF